MLRHHVSVKRGRIFSDLDLKIAHGVAGIERTDQRNERLDNRFASGQFRKIEIKFFPGRSKIKNAIFGQSGGESIRIAMIELERETMQSVGNFVAISG